MTKYIYSILYKHTISILVVSAFIATVATIWHLSYISRQSTENTALYTAKNYSEALRTFRTLYTSQVVVPMKKKGLDITHNYADNENAIPLPATLSMMIGNHLSKDSDVKTYLYSKYPFPWRMQEGLKDDFRRRAWESLNKNRYQPFYEFTEENNQRILRYATADVMRESCVNCHNTHPQTPKDGWETGDVRGVLEVSFSVDDIHKDLSSTAILLAVMIFSGVVFLGFILHALRNSHRDLEQQASNMEKEIQERKHVENNLIKNETLLKKEQLASKQQTEILQILNHHLQTQDLLQAGMVKIIESSHSQMGLFYIFNKQNLLLEPKNGYAVPDSELFRKNYALGESFVGEAGQLKTTIHLRDLTQTNWPLTGSGGMVAIQSLLFLPLVVQHELIGVLVVGSTHSHYAQNTISFLEKILFHFAAALSNIFSRDEIISLAEDLKVQRSELEKQNKILRNQEYELLEKQREVETANRLKSEFLATMSHELRTPMNIIIGFTGLVIKKTRDILPKRQLKNLEKVLLNSKSLLHSLNDILDISKIESGKMELYYTSFNVAETLGESVQYVDVLKNDDVEIILEIAPQLNDFYCDKEKFLRIINNLLSNAVKFTHQGSVTLKAYHENDYLVCACIDTGVGISPAAQRFIFEEFRQEDASTTRKYGGTGLGLSIVKKLVDVFQGKIELDSEEGKGSTFTVKLPLVSPSTKTDVVKSNSILIIENDIVALQSMKKNLEDEGYSVVCSFDKEQGLHIAKRIIPQVIILELFLSRESSYEIIQSLKCDAKTMDIPIIVVSNVDDKFSACETGIAACLVKPVEKKILIATIQRLCLPENLSVLIVDDSPEIQEIVKNVLEEHGHTVTSAYNGKEALQTIERNKPQLILLDLMMPVMDGFEVLDQLHAKNNWRDIPVIVLTAKDLSAEEKKLLQIKAQKVMEKKCFSEKNFIEELKKVLTRV
ncbi:response regulator [Candidatus Uabimicrobium amorphum]|uniref:histidine kinase n=1 Tax=Uabimicrobium amorphum TaxID=2596890 RepID=A0A5S9IT34_UABAM|nr:response regulator [Candidatus Uabimicrobium amorphum]BBM86921.1 two-component hybrid sensor and regulator [Candidatus Uabimicrobium amorphum]